MTMPPGLRAPGNPVAELARADVTEHDQIPLRRAPIEVLGAGDLGGDAHAELFRRVLRPRPRRSNIRPAANLYTIDTRRSAFLYNAGLHMTSTDSAKKGSADLLILAL